MSLILDALHRSDQERNNQDTVAGLHTQHRESVISNFNPRGLLAGVAVLLLALLIWVLMRESTPGPSVISASSIPALVPAAGNVQIEPAQEVPAPKASGAPQAVRAQSGRAGMMASSAVESEPNPISTAAMPDLPEAVKPNDATVARSLPIGVAELYQRAQVPVEPAAGAVALETAPPHDSTASRAAAPTTSAGVQSAATEAVAVEAILAAAHREMVTPPLDEDPTPQVQDLPEDTRDALPSIFFSSHSWSNQDSEKQVTLNGEVLYEGDTVMPGVRLIEIMPEYIVLDFQGTRFRLRALNSWVNL